MLKQSLEDKMAANGKDMDEEKAAKAEAEEGKATAEGDLETTEKALVEAQAALEEANRNCMQVATDHEETAKGRSDESAAIAQAKKILGGSTTGAVGQTYSLLQTSSSSEIKMRARTTLAGAELLTLLKHLAQEQHSNALTQLASRVSAVLKFGATGGDDVFAKVKGLIQDMLDKLLKEAEAEATEKSYCDEEMAKTKEKKGELDDDIEKLTAKIDVAAARLGWQRLRSCRWRWILLDRSRMRRTCRQKQNWGKVCRECARPLRCCVNIMEEKKRQYDMR